MFSSPFLQPSSQLDIAPDPMRQRPLNTDRCRYSPRGRPTVTRSRCRSRPARAVHAGRQGGARNEDSRSSGVRQMSPFLQAGRVPPPQSTDSSPSRSPFIAVAPPLSLPASSSGPRRAEEDGAARVARVASIPYDGQRALGESHAFLRSADPAPGHRTLHSSRPGSKRGPGTPASVTQGWKLDQQPVDEFRAQNFVTGGRRG